MSPTRTDDSAAPSQPAAADVRRLRLPPGSKLATRVADVAAAQHGVVTTAQLVELGVRRHTIARLRTAGWLHRRYRGVYAVGHPLLTPDGHLMAAVLACGPGATLSHRSAAAAWGLRPSSRARVDVTTARAGGRGHAAIDAHRSALDPRDRTTLRAIPITTIARTALDLAEVVPQRHLERFLVAAEQQRLLDLNAIDEVIARARGRHGLEPLEAALAAYRPEATRTKSEMELRALELIAVHDLPRPRVNDRRGRYEIDLHWPGHRLAVELDSRTFHLTQAAFEDDRRRDLELATAGYRTARITWRQLNEEPAWVADRLAILLERA